MINFKKENSKLYNPKTTPSIIDVPKMVFIAVDGAGNPNTSVAYKEALELLYSFAYTIKMSKMSDIQPIGYQDFVVAPLEGLWWFKDGGIINNIMNKDDFAWTSMIRLPDFVTNDVFIQTKKIMLTKKPHLAVDKLRLMIFNEGLCAQIMHIGTYDDEIPTIAILEKFIIDSNYKIDLNDNRRHHEIYLNDPRKTADEKLKTIIRYPIKK